MMPDHATDPIPGSYNVTNAATLVTGGAVADYFGVHPGTIHEWRTRKHQPLPAQRLGRQYLFDMAEVEAWARRTRTLRRQKVTRAPEPTPPATPAKGMLASTVAALSAADRAVLDHLLHDASQRTISALGQNDRDILEGLARIAEQLTALGKLWQ